MPWVLFHLIFFTPILLRRGETEQLNELALSAASQGQPTTQAVLPHTSLVCRRARTSLIRPYCSSPPLSARARPHIQGCTHPHLARGRCCLCSCTVMAGSSWHGVRGLPPLADPGKAASGNCWQQRWLSAMRQNGAGRAPVARSYSSPLWAPFQASGTPAQKEDSAGAGDTPGWAGGQESLLPRAVLLGRAWRSSWAPGPSGSAELLIPWWKQAPGPGSGQLPDEASVLLAGITGGWQKRIHPL